MGIECPKLSKGQVFKTIANGGGVAAGATAEFFVMGSTVTHLATYSDAGQSVANANPVVADSNGRFGYIFLQNMPYGVIVKDADGNEIYREDPIYRPKIRIKAAALPAVHWAGLEVHLTSDGHLWERNNDDTAWTDRGPIDGVGNTSTVSETIALANAAHFITPANLFGLMGLSAVALTAAATLTLDSGGGKLFVVNGAATTITNINSTTDAREILLYFSTAQKLGNGAGITTPNSVTLDCPAGCFVRLIRYNSTWTVIMQSQVGQRLCYLGTQRFTASGTYTRSANCVIAFARTVGPGASGGASDTCSASNGSVAGGGGAGAYVEEWVAPGATETVTIGTGGAAQATAATAGNNGSGPSSFGSFHSAAAGVGGAAGMANGNTVAKVDGGAGGVASNGGLNINGSNGGTGVRFPAVNGLGTSGGGGSNPLGRGGLPAINVGAIVNGAAGVGYGAGGAGGAGAGSAAVASGGAGTDGISIVDEYGII